MRAKLVEADPSLLDEPEESALLRRVDEEDKAVGVALDRLQAAFDDPKATDIDLERALQHLGIARLRCNAARIRAGVANSRIQERPQ